MSYDLTRRLAVEGLLKVENSSFSNLVFSSIAQNHRLTDAQRAFTAKLFYGTVERMITLNYILSRFVSKPLKKLDREVLAIMQSGLYQILYMDSVPVFAAVNQAVSLCSYFKKTSAKGLVNAVLRKAANFDLKNAEFKNDRERISVTYSVSGEIADILMRDYPDSCEDILAGMFNTPELIIVVNTVKISVEDYKKSLDEAEISWERTPLDNCLKISFRGAVTALPGFEQGHFFVQGLASRYAVYSAKIKKGRHILDLCAAPGGKTFSAAIDSQNTAQIISCDPNPSRLPLIEQGAARMVLDNIHTLENRGEVRRRCLGGQDVVLCDVPCSGIGIIAKKPDLRFKPLEKIRRLCRLQQEILQTASGYLKPSGKLVYSTCTLNKMENERQIEKFLSANPDFRLSEQNCPLDGAVNCDNMITFLPSRANCDGFFVAVLEKMW